MFDLVGKYKHYKSENLENYLSAIGVPYLVRKIIASSSPSLEISVTDDVWCLQLHTLVKTMANKFKINEEFEENMPTGTTMKSKASLEGQKLIINSTIVETGIQMTRSYMRDEEGCILAMNHEGKTTAKRYFRRT